jgi:enoyl-CoA hydratase/carnithine racemase
MTVALQREGSIAILVLNDPDKKNAMTEEMGNALQAHVHTLQADDTVRAVVLIGAGDAFCAGGDLAMLQRLRQSSYDDARQHMLSFYARYLSLLDLPVPTIAAVHGAAIGAGLCVAAACDLMVVGEDAKLAFNFVSLGLHPGMAATYLVPRRVSLAKAHELLFTGKRFRGSDAHQWGLANEVAANDGASVRAAAMAMATTIASQGPQAVRMLKASLAPDRVALNQALAKEAAAQAHSYGSAELGEGLQAASERRPPRFG